MPSKSDQLFLMSARDERREARDRRYVELDKVDMIKLLLKSTSATYRSIGSQIGIPTSEVVQLVHDYELREIPWVCTKDRLKEWRTKQKEAKV
jgi:hypothetical protein